MDQGLLCRLGVIPTAVEAACRTHAALEGMFSNCKGGLMGPPLLHDSHICVVATNLETPLHTPLEQ